MSLRIRIQYYPASNLVAAVERLHWLFLRNWNAEMAAGKLSVKRTDGSLSTTQSYTDSGTSQTVSP